jgi:thymidine kinase
MNLLGSLLNERKNALFVAPNASFREVMVSQLTKEYDANRIRHLIKGSSAFYASRKNTFDVIIVDEAHRLKNEKAFMYKGKNQVEDIINAAKVSIFFIDEKQIIRPEDIGTLEEISRVAELHGAKIDKLNLKAQFRCSGAEGYINWVDDVLNIEETGNYDSWDKQDFEFKILDNPNTLKDEISQKAREGYKARMLAGYSWEWTAANKGNANGKQG